MRSVTVFTPGTCGEFVQGMLDDQHFLVSCPVNLFSAVTVSLRDDGRIIALDDVPKAETATRAALRYLGVGELGARLSIVSPLPRGKGMGSSTADVTGAIYAVALAAGRAIEPLEVARLALSVEPTNSSLFPNLALFDHRRGIRYFQLGDSLPADVLVFDCGGEVDTLAYNARDRTSALREMEPLIAESLALVSEGIRRSDLGLLGKGSTLSALAHQRIAPKPSLQSVIDAGKDLGAVGVVVAHSGTVIGVIFPRGNRHRLEITERFAADLHQLTIVGWCQTNDGGYFRKAKGDVKSCPDYY